MRTPSVPPARRPPRVPTRAIVLTAASLAAATCLPSSPGPAPPSLSERDRAVHLLSRATYGVRPGDVEEVLRVGGDAWLERQLHPESIDDGALEARLVALAEQGSQGPAARVVAASMRPRAPRVGGDNPPPPDTGSLADAQARRVAELAMQARVFAAAAARPGLVLPGLVAAKVERAVHSERQLEEVMTDFWLNHFNVFYNKGQVGAVLADYEENAIRRNVFGRFEEMLVATARHPAMLIYLDNARSTAPVEALPTPPRRQARPQRGGLNENYARELLELHTLGVDGGYTQEDVVEVARAFTGWGIATRPPSVRRTADGAAVTSPQRVEFQFQAARHDEGSKTVLGRALPAGRGMEEGLEILGMLSRHPATAEHLATKLVRHFVSDDPPPKLVAELARAFRDTDGDLRAVTRALFTADAFYDPAHYRSKVKRPFEFVASALRVTGAEIRPQGQGLVPRLRTFGHLPYGEAAPTGYAVTADEWVSAGAMLGRMNFALDVIGGRVPGVRLDPWALLGDDAESVRALLQEPSARAPSRVMDRGEALRASTEALLRRIVHGASTAELATLIAEDLAGQERAAPPALVARAAALALGSPEFQRH